MTDFYARLEDQLVTAAREGAQRSAVGRAVAGRRPQLLAALAAAAVLVAGVSFLPSAFGPTASTQPAAPAGSRPEPRPLAPGDLNGIRVAVFNASIQSGRAREYGDRLEERGAVITLIGNYRVQGIYRRYFVRYRPGAAALARRVAAVLRVPRATEATAADAAITRDADVIVVVGTVANRSEGGRRGRTGTGDGAGAPSRAPNSPPDGGHFAP